MAAMSKTNTSALTRASRRLKELSSDAISLPTPAELYDRKVAELHDARRKLDAIVARQVKAEGWSLDHDGSRRMNGKPDPRIIAEKQAAIALIERLEGEASLLYESVRPQPRLSPEQQYRSEMFRVSAPERKGGSDDAIRQARDEAARMVERELQGRVHGRDIFRPDPTEAAELRKARARLMALEGDYNDAQRGTVSREDYAQAKKEIK